MITRESVVRKLLHRRFAYVLCINDGIAAVYTDRQSAQRALRRREKATAGKPMRYWRIEKIVINPDPQWMDEKFRWLE